MCDVSTEYVETLDMVDEDANAPTHLLEFD